MNNKPMNLMGKALDVWFLEQDNSNFPLGKDYKVVYNAVTLYLNTNVHTQVNLVANSIDDTFLTSHGPDHIATVINRASELLNTDKADITPYEVFILIMAIHFHDAGHIVGGRKEHEENQVKIINMLGPLFSTDSSEIALIKRIAAAHGGRIGGSKDKINTLPEIQSVLHKPVRIRLLAALLRFADELAEDSTRAAKVPMEFGNIPRSSQIYHVYAKALQSVDINARDKQVKLSYSIKKEDAVQKFGKDDGEIFLMDYIIERNIKAHFERMYCMRFTRPVVDIEKILIQIELLDEAFNLIHPPINYRLSEHGYPGTGSDTIESICEEMPLLRNDQPMSGLNIKNFIEQS